MKNTIRYIREERKMTQLRLAQRTGVSRQTINAIENGRFLPSTVLSLKISKVLQKPIEELFFLEEYD